MAGPFAAINMGLGKSIKALNMAALLVTMKLCNFCGCIGLKPPIKLIPIRGMP